MEPTPSQSVVSVHSNIEVTKQRFLASNLACHGERFHSRKMLRAIVETDKRLLPLRRHRVLSAAQAEEVLWVLDQIDKKLRHQRNNALHAPLIIVTGVFDGAVRSWVEAHFNSLNPRAKPLRGKDLIQ